MATLVILNPHAGSGRAGRSWSKLEPLLWEKLGDLVVAITEHPEEVTEHLDKALNMGVEKVVTVGGDGTNHVVINALADLARQNPGSALPIFGSVPMGTGRDWARTIGTPLNPKDAVEWLASAQPMPIDIGRFTTGDTTTHFLNIASAGISGEIGVRVNRIQHRKPWTFVEQTVRALMGYKPRVMRVHLDGELWYEGSAFVVAVANGRNFGHGMFVAPNARIDDGLFDVILVEGMPRLQAIMALPSLFQGTHLKRSDVHHRNAKQVVIEPAITPLDMELDGEYRIAKDLIFDVEHHMIQMLGHPDAFND